MIRIFAKLSVLKLRTGYLAMLVLAMAVGAHAQAPGSSRGLSSGDGTHTIQGRVFFPPGQGSSAATV